MEQEVLSSLVTVNVKHVFTEEEKVQQSYLLAKTVKDCETVEGNKKADMGVYKNKIDTLKAEIKDISGKINNGYDFVDKPAELLLDYDENKRIYKSKDDGSILKTEGFHPSDYQKKIDFTGISGEIQEQIDENNAVGEYAEQQADENGMYIGNNGNLTDIKPVQDTLADPLDKVIADKKKSGKSKEKPQPKELLPPNYNRDEEVEEEFDPFE